MMRMPMSGPQEGIAVNALLVQASTLSPISTRITDLNDDVIEEIFSNLEFDHGSLLNTSLVSKRFSYLASRHLYRHLAFSLAQESSIDFNFTGIDQAVRCSKTLECRPEYVKYVHSVALDWEVEDELILPFANQILEQLPNLRRLSLQSSKRQPRRDEICFVPAFLEKNPVRKLKRIELQFPSLAESVPVWLTIPSASEIVCRCMDLSRPSARPEHEYPAPMTVPLELLELDDCVFTYQALSRLLACRPRIRKLSCPMPGETDSSAVNTGPTRHSARWMVSAHSARDLQKALEPVAEYLEEFELTGGNRWWNAGDDTRLNLSHFSALTKLEIFSSCLFPSGRHVQGQRDGVYQLLPRTLQDLKITFCSNDALLCKTRAEKVHFVHMGGHVDSWRYSWLMELARYKPDYFPYLSSILIQELESNDGVVPWIEWKVGSVTDAFKEARIDLKVLLRPLRLQLNRVSDVDPTTGGY